MVYEKMAKRIEFEELEQQRSTNRNQAFHHPQSSIWFVAELQGRLELPHSVDCESNRGSSFRMTPSIRIGEH